MKYCSHCGSPEMEQRIPDGDHRPRWICGACAAIFYENPKVVAGCVPVLGDRILLCRRAIEPRHGLWTLPAGFMENHETTEQAALRETREETRAQVDLERLYSIVSIPRISQVYLLFLAHLRDEDFGPTRESLEVRLFREPQIPWERLAFPVVHQTLKRYFEERREGRFSLHVGTL